MGPWTGTAVRHTVRRRSDGAFEKLMINYHIAHRNHYLSHGALSQCAKHYLQAEVGLWCFLHMAQHPESIIKLRALHDAIGHGSLCQVAKH